jgi:hypothetical protein
VGPDNVFDPGEEFLERLTEVASVEVKPPRPAPITFATTQEALDANDKLLREYGYDLDKLFQDYPETTLGFGSEFRTIAQLEKVLGGYPEFGVLTDLIKKGMNYKFSREITEEEKLRELRGMIERGNHKATEKSPKKAEELLAKDVAH